MGGGAQWDQNLTELWPSAIVRFWPDHSEVTVRPSVLLCVESYENWYTPPRGYDTFFIIHAMQSIASCWLLLSKTIYCTGQLFRLVDAKHSYLIKFVFCRTINRRILFTFFVVSQSMMMIQANFAPLGKRFDQSFSGGKYSHFKVMPWTVCKFPRYR